LHVLETFHSVLHYSCQEIAVGHERPILPLEFGERGLSFNSDEVFGVENLDINGE